MDRHDVFQNIAGKIGSSQFLQELLCLLLQGLGGWCYPAESNHRFVSPLPPCNTTNVAFGKRDHTHVLHPALRWDAGSLCHSSMTQYSQTAYPNELIKSFTGIFPPYPLMPLETVQKDKPHQQNQT